MDDEIFVFRSSAFTASIHDSTNCVPVLRDNDPAREVGERPALANTTEGLAFRLDLTDNPRRLRSREWWTMATVRK